MPARSSASAPTRCACRWSRPPMSHVSESKGRWASPVCNSAMPKKKDDGTKIVADNRKARYAYAIDETLEAGIMLTGSEVKSLRTGKATIGEAYAHAKEGELFLVN